MPRRAGGLWPHVVSFATLICAARRALRGKRLQTEATNFHRRLEAEVFALQHELVSGTYRPGVMRGFWIEEPKRRLISAAPFRDRVVHHALVAVLEPLFERRFVVHSYACRPGRGTHRAIRCFTRWARATGQVLKLDVRKYFPSIDHAILMNALSRTVRCDRTLALCDRFLAAAGPSEPHIQWFPGDTLLTPLSRPHGLPIGNLTSQFFANVYLDPLDHAVTDTFGVRRYLRYMDDIAVCDSDKGRLREVRAFVSEQLSALRLRLNEGKSRIRRLSEGVGFLGFVHYPNRARVAPAAVRRLRRRLAPLRGAEWGARFRAWLPHASHGNTWRLRKSIVRGMRRN